MPLIDLITDLSNFSWTDYGSVTNPVNNIPDINSTGFTNYMQNSQFTGEGIPNIPPFVYNSLESFTLPGNVDADTVPIVPPDENIPGRSNIDSSGGPGGKILPPIGEITLTTTPAVPNTGESNIINITPRKAKNSLFETTTSIINFKSTELKTFNIKSQYTKLKYKNNDVLGFDQPFIIRNIGNNWGIDKADSFLKSPIKRVFNIADTISGLIIGNKPSVVINRTEADISRIGKFLITPQGVGFLTKQTLLQKLNQFPSTRKYNILSLGSIIPMVHIDRYIIGTEFDLMDFIEKNGSQILSNTASYLKEKMAWGASGIKSEIKIAGKYIGDKLEEAGKPIYNTYNKFLPKDSSVRMKINSISDKIQNAGEYVSSKIKISGGNIKNELSNIGSDLLQKVDVPVGIIKDKLSNAIIKGSNQLINPMLPTRHYDSITDMERDGNPPHGNNRTYYTLPYSQLDNISSYEKLLITPRELLTYDGSTLKEISDNRFKLVKKIKNVGETNTFPWEQDKTLGVIKKNIANKYNTGAVDKVNLIPYGSDKLGDSESNDVDFIPFKIKDVVNNKWIIFRAILNGISDSIQPEWSEDRYVGRPDKVYVYQGVTRDISFSFAIYPKTKQELPVLWEKLNYLIGLCYPSWGDIKQHINSQETSVGKSESYDAVSGKRMISPFIELTIGNMYRSTPGYLSSLDITVEDNTTWELDKNYQLPKYLSISCGFKYIGKYLPNSIGKHYELDWLTDKSGNGSGTFINSPIGDESQTYPNRNSGKINLDKLFKELGQ